MVHTELNNEKLHTDLDNEKLYMVMDDTDSCKKDEVPKYERDETVLINRKMLIEMFKKK